MLASMNHCPRHLANMRLRRGSAYNFEECPDCLGVWIPGSRIDENLGKGQLLQLRSLCSINESKLNCPRCTSVLYEGKVGGVTIDFCQECNGLWLDPGELDSLKARRPVTPYQAPVKDDPVQLGVSTGNDWLIPVLVMGLLD